MVYNYYLELADCNVIKDPDFGDIYPAEEGPGNVLVCDFYTATTGDGTVLPEGTYTLADSYADGSLNPGYTWAAGYDEDGNETQMGFLSGTIDVVSTGGGYRLTVNLVTEDGNPYTGMFTGTITFENLSEMYAPAARGVVRAGNKAARLQRR